MFAFVAMATCTAATLVMLCALCMATRHRVALESDSPPVTVLKPLAGADDALERNLETFFALDYPCYELVFGVVSATDPAAEVAQRLIARHPHVAARLVIHDGRHGLNPKVANLRGMLEAGGYDICVVSDSNIATAPGGLRSMVRCLEGRVGLVMSLFSGAGERSLGATLENLHICGYVAGGVAASELVTGNALVVGKSLLFRRSTFETLGGLESLASVLAEDYVMGRMFTEAGYEVRLADEIVVNVNERGGLGTFLGRQGRWALMRSRIKPLAYPFEPFLVPLAVGMGAALLESSTWPLVWAALLTTVRDTVGWLRLRGRKGLLRALPFGLLKDALLLAAWASAPFRKHVSWRGHRLRVSAGSRLFAERPALFE